MRGSLFGILDYIELHLNYLITTGGVTVYTDGIILVYTINNWDNFKENTYTAMIAITDDRGNNVFTGFSNSLKNLICTFYRSSIDEV